MGNSTSSARSGNNHKKKERSAKSGKALPTTDQQPASVNPAEQSKPAQTLSEFHGLPQSDLEPFLVPETLRIHPLSFATSFATLSEQERRYVHHLSKALRHGFVISSRQICKEYAEIQELILAILKPKEGESKPDYDGIKEKSGVSDEEWKAFTK